jgi:hypothetical protein
MGTDTYDRTFQLLNSATSYVDGIEGVLSVDHLKFKAVESDKFYNTYMDFYGSESYGGKTYAEWVSE